MKRYISIIVIALILVVIVVLSGNNSADEVVTTSGELVTTGIVEPTPPPPAPVITKQPSPTTIPEEDIPEERQKENSEEEIEEEDSPSHVTPAPAPQAPTGIAVGNKAPNFVLQAFDGSVIELDALNTPVVIDFWAGWCPFCVAELPDLEAAHQAHGNEITFLGIHRTDTESVEKGQAFARDRGVTYPLLKDSDGSVYKTYTGGQSFMPVAFFIDAQGIIQERVFGPKDKQKLDASISTLR